MLKINIKLILLSSVLFFQIQSSAFSMEKNEEDNNKSSITIKTKNKNLIVEVPVGSIISFAGDKEPEGWLMCDGSQYSSKKYPKLFEIIKEKYVPSNSWVIEANKISTEKFFHVPDMRGRIIVDVDKIGGLHVDVGRIELSGDSQLHNNMQPYKVLNYIINTGKINIDEKLKQEKNIKQVINNLEEQKARVSQAITLTDIEEYDAKLVSGYRAPKYGHSWIIFNPSNSSHQYHMACQNCGKTAPPPTWMVYDKIPKFIEANQEDLCVSEVQTNERELVELRNKIGPITLKDGQTIVLPTKLMPHWSSLKYVIVREIRLEDTKMAQETRQMLTLLCQLMDISVKSIQQ